MDSNKDEALRCVSIAREAIASGNKQRAVKFIDIARRLNHNLSVDDLLAACENMNSGSPGPSSDEKLVDSGKNKVNSRMVDEVSNGERNYTEEHVQLVSKIKRSRDYYDILGVERSCSVEEVKRAYRKLSLKVHPDKNKAPGSEEAFKKVSKAFKCLSNDDSRREYDQTGLIEDFDYGQQYNVRRRRRRTGHDLFDDDFDPDEIFRSFFGHGPQGDMFRASHVYRTRAAANQAREENVRSGPNLILFLQILPFFIIFLLAYLPLSEPDYSLQKNYSYQLPRITEKHGIEFYVKSVDFDQNYPLGSPVRASIEENVIKDYKNLLGRYCHIELQRRQWSRNLPTPHCDKLKSFGVS